MMPNQTLGPTAKLPSLALDSGIPDRNDGCSGLAGTQSSGSGASIAILCLLGWSLALPSVADELDLQLERNMRVYKQARPQAGVYGQSLAYEPGVGTQAQMVVFDRMGRANNPQRVALGPLPPPPTPAEEELKEYPRHPQPPKPAWEFDYGLSSGYRQDRLNFNIAARNNPPYGYRKPNILSELKWENINVAQIAAKSEITSPGGWHFQGNVDYGFITSGKNQDSDYDFNNRTLEWSRSNNSADGGHMFDTSIGAGYRFAKRDKEGKVQVGLAPLVGYSYNEQNLTMGDLLQTVMVPSVSWCLSPQSKTPCRGPAVGTRDSMLDNSYYTQWHGPWLGFKANGQVFDWMELFAQYEYHWAYYYAKGNWNLRDSFAHPISFEHDTDGQGMKISAGLLFKLTPNWALNLDANYLEMNTNPGTNNTHFVYGLSTTTRLNRVQWESYGVNAGMRYRF